MHLFVASLSLVLGPAFLHTSLERAPSLAFGGAGTEVPRVELNAKGLFVDGSLRCDWQGGAFDAAHGYNMVLTSPGRKKDDNSPCDASPFLSRWGDGGVGTAELLLAVTGTHGEIATVRVGAGSIEMLVPEGWSWYGMSPAETAARDAQTKEVLAEPALQKFLRDAEACAGSKKWKSCLPVYLKSEMYEDGALDDEDRRLKKWAVTPARYVEWLEKSGRLPALRACFARDAIRSVSTRDEVRLESAVDGWTAIVERTPDGWRLGRFAQGC